VLLVASTLLVMLTRAEATGFRETSLHADVMRFVAGLAAAATRGCTSPASATARAGASCRCWCSRRDGVRTPAEARAAGLPVVLMLDGIHPGEVEGKEASLALVRDLLDGQHPDWLEETLLVAPLFNPDGNDALDPANRRLDLEEARTASRGRWSAPAPRATGINLNRDYMRQAAPEMRLLQAGVCSRGRRT
jgi:hypothetical protein